MFAVLGVVTVVRFFVYTPSINRIYEEENQKLTERTLPGGDYGPCVSRGMRRENHLREFAVDVQNLSISELKLTQGTSASKVKLLFSFSFSSKPVLR